MKGLNYLRMNWIAYQKRLDCISADDHKGDTTYITSKGSTSIIVLIENEPVIGIAHIRAIFDGIQAIIMKVAWDICMIVQWSGHSCASESCSISLTWNTRRVQGGIAGGHRSCFIKSFGNIEGYSTAVPIFFKMGLHIAVGGGSPPFARMSIPYHASEGDSIELVVNQSQKHTAVNATTPLHSHRQGTSNAMQRTPHQNVFFVKETMTYLADKFVWGIVKLDPRAKLIIFWICYGIRHVWICLLDLFQVVVLEKTGGVLKISK